MADKHVTLQVDADVNDSKIKTLDQELVRLKQQQLQLKINADKSALNEVETRIQNINTLISKSKSGDIHFNVDDSLIQKAQAELDALESQKINLQIAVADDELQHARAEVESLNTSATVSLAVDESAVQGAMQNITDGFSQAKQGASELSGAFSGITDIGMMDQQNQAFLEMNLGAEEAAKQVKLINDTVASMPGDDSTMRSILSTAQAMGENLDPKQMKEVSRATANYLQGSMSRGKLPLEAQSDILKYIIDGNTAELEKGSIVSKQIDILKDRNSVMDRTKAMTEALNKEGFMKGDTGIADMDTLANKTQSWEGALYNAKTTMAGLWMDGLKGIEEFGLKLDDATGGLSSIAFVVGQEFGPGLLTMSQGLFTMIPGIIQLSQTYGGLGGALSAGAGAITGFGSTLLGVATGPVGILIAALIAIGVAVYEVGKYFNWWHDLPSMFSAIAAGATELWNTFITNEYVIQAIDMIKQGFMDLWNAAVQFGQAIMTALTGSTTEYDNLGAMVNNLGIILSTVGPVITFLISAIITYFKNLYYAGQQVWPYLSAIISGAVWYIRSSIQGTMNLWSLLQGAWERLSSNAEVSFGLISGFVAAAASSWEGFKDRVMGTIQAILDKINEYKNAASNLPVVGGLFSGGIETPAVSGGSYGSGPTMVSQGNTLIFNMYGDIKDEKTLDDTIDAINNRIQFEALATGINTTNNTNSGVI